MKKNSLFILLSLLAFACKEKTVDNKETSKPNVLLIVVDDLGYADFEPFSNADSTKAHTPNMSNIGKEGITYAQAYTTAPVCSPSRVGMITAKNQFRWDKPASWGPGLPDSVKTIAEYLKEAGYATARIGKNDLGRNFHKNNVREYPLKHGYDEFLGFNAHAHDYWLLSREIKDITPDPSGTSAVLGPLMHNMGEKSYNEGYLTDILTDEAITYIKQKRENPFFLTLSYSAVHHLIHEVPQLYLDKYDVKPIPNYHPDSLVEYGRHKPGSYSAYYDKYSRLGAIQDRDLRAYYLANLHNLDDNIGRVLSALKSENLDEDTMVIFLSDNGGSPLTGANNSPLTGGKYSLWEGGIRIPMAIRYPGKIDENRIESRYVSALDIMPTVLNFAGIETEDNTIDGIDLMNPIDDRLLVWKWQKTWAVRKGDWKLTNSNENHWKSRPYKQYVKPIANNFELKLFNIANDPGERINLVEKHPDIAKRLEKEYQNWCADNIGKF